MQGRNATEVWCYGQKKIKIKLTEMVTSDFLQGNLNDHTAT
jgi:hypothetical protein